MCGRLGTLSRTLLAKPALQVLLILLLFKVSWLWFFVVSILPEDAYRSSSVFLAMSESPILALFVVFNLGLFSALRHRVSWQAIDDSGCARLFVMVSVVLMSLQFGTSDINFYYGETHLVDRLLVLFLGGLVWLHPLFATLWFSLVMAMAGQLHHPLQESEWLWADKRLILDFLVLFQCFLYVRLIAPMKSRMLLVMTLALTGATYFFAGQSKMMLGPHWYSWVVDDQLSNIVVAAYKNGGWLRPLGDQGIVDFAGGVTRIEGPLAAATLLIELGGALLFFHRRLTSVLLVFFVGMHLGILATTGIFFWKWSLFDIALLLYLNRFFRKNPNEAEVLQGLDPLWESLGRRWGHLKKRISKQGADPRKGRRLFFFFGPSLSLGMTAIMLVPRVYSMPTGFGWYDSPLTNYFEFRGVGESGRSYELTPRFFAPYDLLVTQSRFYFLVPYPVLAGTYGTVHDHRLASELRDADLADLEAIRRKWGKNQYDPERAAAFAEFVRTFVRNAQQRGDDALPVLGWLAPPYHFQTFAPDDVYDFQEPLERVEIHYREYFYDGEKLHTVLETPAVRIDLL